jgi:hypothetical protein
LWLRFFYTLEIALLPIRHINGLKYDRYATIATSSWICDRSVLQSRPEWLAIHTWSAAPQLEPIHGSCRLLHSLPTSTNKIDLTYFQLDDSMWQCWRQLWLKLKHNMCRPNMPNRSKKMTSDGLCCSVGSTSRLEVILGKSVLIPSIILNLSMRFKQFKEMVPLMGPPSVNTSATVRLHVPEDGHRDSHFWGRSEVRVDVFVCILLGIRDLSSSPLISVLSSSCTFLHKSCLMD